MSGPRVSLVPHALLTSLIAIWAVSFVMAKVAMTEVNAFALVALRFSLAGLCLLPFLLRASAAERRASLLPGVVAGLVMGAAYLMQMFGVRETTASMGGFVTGLIVLLVALGGRFVFHAPLGARAIAGLVLGLAGIVTLCARSGDDDPTQQNTLRGMLLQVGSAALFAVHILLLSHFGKTLSALVFTCWQFVVISAMGWVAVALQGDVALDAARGVNWTFEVLGAIAYLGVMANAVAIGVQARIQHRIPPQHLALLFALQPLFAALAGWMLQGDHLGSLQWTGGGLIVAGVVVAALDRR
ncbi:MAG: DMT family transporter [Planctomycetes bacterium]|nr:DMT family transporter [Planctomycetota bacterium]